MTKTPDQKPAFHIRSTKWLILGTDLEQKAFVPISFLKNGVLVNQICTQFSVVVGVGDVAVSRTGGCALFLKSLCTSTASTMSTQ